MNELTLDELLTVYRGLSKEADENGFITEGSLGSVIHLIAWVEKIAQYKARRYRQMLEIQGYVENRGGGTSSARWYIVLKGPELISLPKRSPGAIKKPG